MKKRLSLFFATLFLILMATADASAADWQYSFTYADAFGATVTGYSDNTATSLSIPSRYYPSEELKKAIVDMLNAAGTFGKPGAAALAKSVAAGYGLPVVSIGSYAFAHFTSLTSVSIPDGITEIADYAFFNCYSLETVNIPQGVTSIGEGAFASCNWLRDIVLPDSLLTIGRSAFESCCYGLAYLDIPNGVTTIGYAAFSGCEALQWIRIPDSVSSIGEYAFYDCNPILYTTNSYAIDYAYNHGLTWQDGE